MNLNKHLLAIMGIFLGVAYYIHTRYLFLVGDQYDNIPLMYRALDPSYLINDWYVNANSGMSVRFFYIQVIAGITHYLALSETMVILYTLSLLATILLVYYIAVELSGSPIVGILSALIILFLPDITLGGSEGIIPYLIPQTVAMPFVLLGFYWFLKERYLLSFTALGIATYFQMLWGLQAAIILTAILGFTAIKTRDINTLVPCLAYPLVSAPALFMTLAVAGGNNPLVINTLLFRMPHHYLPFTWPIGNYILFFMFSCLVITAGLYARKRNAILLKILALVIVLWCIGTVFVELVPIAPVIKLQLFKSTFFFVVFGTILIITTLFQHLPTLEIPTTIPVLIVCVLLGISGIYLISSTNITPALSQNEELYQRVLLYTWPDDTFLVPPLMQDFRTGTNRSVVVDWKGVPLKDAALIEYNKRINDITGQQFTRPLTIEQMNEYYENLSAQQITDLKKKYNATYAIQGGVLI